MLTARTAVSALSAASTALSVIWSTLSSCLLTVHAPSDLVDDGENLSFRPRNERRKASDGSGQTQKEICGAEPDREQEDGKRDPPEISPRECGHEHLSSGS